MNSIALEACTEAVQISGSNWVENFSNAACVPLEKSEPNKQRVSSLLSPGQSFYIGYEEFVLHPVIQGADQEVQVQSSGPVEVRKAEIDNDEQPQSLAIKRVTTPTPKSGTAVMETPLTERQRLNCLPATRDATTSDPAYEESQELGSHMDLNKASPTDIPGVERTDEPLISDLDGSQISAQESSRDTVQVTGPALAKPQERASGEIASIQDFDLNDALPSQQAFPVSQVSEEEPELEDIPPRKRPKHLLQKKQFLGTDESQSGVKSTIHVEVTSPKPTKKQSKKSLKSKGPTTTQNVSSQRSQEPISSGRSMRSSPKITRSDDLPESGRRIFFASSTTVGDSAVYTKFLRQNHITKAMAMADCDLLCVGKGELKKTSNLINAVLMGKQVVSELWIKESAKKNKLLDESSFYVRDREKEQEWGTTLADAISRGQKGVKPFQNWTVNFTPSAKKELGKSWTELKDICLTAGATAVQAMIPRKSAEELPFTIVVIASKEPDAETIQQRGFRTFSKDLITGSVLRGEIDESSDEFLVKPEVKKTSTGVGKKRKR